MRFEGGLTKTNFNPVKMRQTKFHPAKIRQTNFHLVKKRQTNFHPAKMRQKQISTLPTWEKFILQRRETTTNAYKTVVSSTTKVVDKASTDTAHKRAVQVAAML